MESTTVDKPKIKPKISTVRLLMITRRTIPIIAIRSQNFSKYPRCPWRACAFRSSSEGSDVTEWMSFITSLCDIQKLQIDNTPPTSTASAKAGDTTIAEPRDKNNSTIQLITCIFCSVNDSSITKSSSLLLSSFPACRGRLCSYPCYARGFRAGTCNRRQYRKPAR